MHETAMSDSIAVSSLTLTCPACGSTTSGATTHFRCACGTPYDLPPDGFPRLPTSPAELRDRFDARMTARPSCILSSGVWRYRELVLPLAERFITTRQEGNTPLYAVGAEEPSGWRRVGQHAGLAHLWLKHEGENPTGSFKDRGMTVGISVARELEARAVACASTGNTSASLAAYAAQAGLLALVFLPAGRVASGKLAQSIAYGAHRIEVEGDFDAAMRAVERVAGDLGLYLLNSINPFRLAGQRAIAYELLHQCGWQPPDWIVLPAGNLGNTSAIGAALLHMHALGLIGRVPRLAAVQATGANPFYASYASQWEHFTPVRARTKATAINIGAPVSVARARAAIAATNGVVTEVSDDQIFAAKAEIDRAGIGCEPASAASVAGARRLVAEGVIARDTSVVCILTGHLLKDVEQATGERTKADGQDTAVNGILEAVRTALEAGY